MPGDVVLGHWQEEVGVLVDPCPDFCLGDHVIFPDSPSPRHKLRALWTLLTGVQNLALALHSSYGEHVVFLQTDCKGGSVSFLLQQRGTRQLPAPSDPLNGDEV